MSQSRPNIVLILADDMGYGDFGVFNGGLTDTEAIDSLVAQGVCLTQHYSASPVCAPARAGLLTGRYPQRSGVVDTWEALGLDRMAPSERTVADLLASHGYATGLVGKWHCGAFDPKYHPTRRGFQEFTGFSGGWSDYYDWQIEQNGAARRSDGTYLTDRLAAEAVSFIHRHSAEPFFLHVAFNAPHFPIQAPDEEVRRYDGRPELTAGVRTLYAMIRRMDQGVARILETLSAEGLTENTVVIFSSDNGPDFGGAGDASLNRFNCNYRGAKTYVYEGGIRVPVVVRWPAGIEVQPHCDEVALFYDWLPTLLEITGAPPPGGVALDGRSLVPVLQGRHGSTNARRAFWHWNRFVPDLGSNAAMRDGRWKLVQPAIETTMSSHDPDEVASLDRYQKYHRDEITAIRPGLIPQRERVAPAAPMLFDIVADPSEASDVSAVYPERVASMSRALARWFSEVEGERLRTNAG